jgi:hypothetical protein
MPDVGGIGGAQLKSFIERIERLEDEKRAQQCMCTGKSNPATSPTRSTIFTNPDLVNGAPRSVTNTCRPSRGAAAAALSLRRQ